MCEHVYVCVCVCEHVYVCGCNCAAAHVCVTQRNIKCSARNAPACACTRTCVHTCVHACVRVRVWRVCINVRVGVRRYVCTCMRESAHVCEYVCVRACIRE